MLVSRIVYISTILANSVASWCLGWDCEGRRKGSCEGTTGLCGDGVTVVKNHYRTAVKEAKNYGITIDIDYDVLSEFLVTNVIHQGAILYKAFQHPRPGYNTSVREDMFIQIQYSRDAALGWADKMYSRYKHKTVNGMIKRLDRMANLYCGNFHDNNRIYSQRLIKHTEAYALKMIKSHGHGHLKVKEICDRLEKYIATDLAPKVQQEFNNIHKEFFDFLFEDINDNFAGGDSGFLSPLPAFLTWVEKIDEANGRSSSIADYPSDSYGMKQHLKDRTISSYFNNLWKEFTKLF